MYENSQQSTTTQQIIILIIPITFIVLLSWHDECQSSLGSIDECRLCSQAAANPHTKPTDLGCRSACRLLPPTPKIAAYYYYSAKKPILIFTVPQRTESGVDLVEQLNTEMVYPSADGQPSKVKTWQNMQLHSDCILHTIVQNCKNLYTVG